MRHILLLFRSVNLLPLVCCVGCSYSIIMVLIFKENGGFCWVDGGVTRTGTQVIIDKKAHAMYLSHWYSSHCAAQ